MKKLHEYFGDEIVITTIKNKAHVVTLRKTAASITHEFYENPKQSDNEEEKAKIIATAKKATKTTFGPFQCISPLNAWASVRRTPQFKTSKNVLQFPKA